MSNFEEQGKVFWQWLEKNGTDLNKDIAIKDYRSEGAGRGIVATKDIKEGELLFSLPRSILLSHLTTSLKDLSCAQEFASLPGWSPLILSIMYESQKPDSFWKPYFDVLPRQFSTPMFWNETDLLELKGTDIVAKIGKEDAEATYERDVKPFVEKYSDIFDKEIHNLELYHTCGSLIMAYSFNDELQKEEESDDDEEEEEEEEEANVLISMVPMADMLNHKTGFNNARLFHEPESLQMRAIKDIKEGEQIYNTYGDLCNADLLRKYGFADDQNEFDIVEIDGPLVVESCCPDAPKELVEQKIDFLMEEGVFDECFVIDSDHEIPPELIVSVHVLLSSADEFETMVEKQKLPKPKLTASVKKVIEHILRKRLEERYPTTMQEDEAELGELKEMSNKRNALLVRVGEKKILQQTLDAFKSLPVALDKKRPSSQLDNKQQKKSKK
ncbi:hypothetical protein INT47_010826 [Mucor saturninus]|uniref:N-lysine methyltransferase SETD6 n=1 Tax=Mucor saturninus TaxID=64648 RepID=A0A8H7QYE3_9FUNG|nr:hypothetical protein INT47_010826 [Mucor saturninus]